MSRSFINSARTELMSRSFTCCLCRSVSQGFGNNPAPLIRGRGSRCCDACNRVVVFVRFSTMRQGAGRLNRANWIRAIRENGPEIQQIRGPVPDPDEEEEEDDWMDVYSSGSFDEWCETAPDSKWRGAFYRQCWGGGPEGGFITTTDGEVWRVNRTWFERFEPSTFERVHGTIETHPHTQQIRIIQQLVQ